MTGTGVGECEGSTSGDSFTPSSHDSSFQHDEEHHEEGEEDEDEEDGDEDDSDWRIYKVVNNIFTLCIPYVYLTLH